MCHGNDLEHSLVLEPLAKQIYRHTPCPAIRRPFEPNLHFLAIILTSDGDFHPYPWKKGKKDLPKRSFFCHWVIKVHQKMKKKKKVNQSMIGENQKEKKIENNERKNTERFFGPNNV